MLANLSNTVARGLSWRARHSTEAYIVESGPVGVGCNGVLQVQYAGTRVDVEQTVTRRRVDTTDGEVNLAVNSVLKLDKMKVKSWRFLRILWFSFSKHGKTLALILYTGKNLSPFYICPFNPLTYGQNLNWANWIIWKALCKESEEWANSRLVESVSNLFKAKIRQGEFKAVYSMLHVNECTCVYISYVCSLQPIDAHWPIRSLNVFYFMSKLIFFAKSHVSIFVHY